MGVEEREADIGQRAGAERNVGRPKVRNKVGVGVETLGKGKLLTGIFLDGFAQDFERWSGGDGFVSGD